MGQWLPVIPQTLSKLEYANVSIPVAILIWLMIYPMMLKVDFQSVKNVGKRPRGIIVTCVTNWLIKPFTMFGIAYLFFYVIFKTFIPAELAEEYLAGAVLLGLHLARLWYSCGVISLKGMPLIRWYKLQ